MSVVDFRGASVVDWFCGHVLQGGRAILVWAKMGEKALRRKFERSGLCTPRSDNEVKVVGEGRKMCRGIATSSPCLPEQLLIGRKRNDCEWLKAGERGRRAVPAAIAGHGVIRPEARRGQLHLANSVFARARSDRLVSNRILSSWAQISSSGLYLLSMN